MEIEWEYERARRRPGDASDDPTHVALRVIEAGVALAYEHPGSEVTVAAAARQAGVSSGAPYVWFGCADDVLDAVAEELTRALLAALGTDVRQDRRKRLLNAARALTTWLVEVPAGFDLVFGRLDRDTESVALRRVRDVLVADMAALAGGAGAGRDVLALCLGHIVLRRIGVGGPTSVDDVAGAVARVASVPGAGRRPV